MFPLDKYRYIVTPNKVIALSTYAGKTVKGIATCSPEDEFNEEFGKKLAAARCNQRVAYLRMKRATDKLCDAIEWSNEVETYLAKMEDYFMDAKDEYLEAAEDVDNLLDPYVF